jgi:hypothetical protein
MTQHDPAHYLVEERNHIWVTSCRTSQNDNRRGKIRKLSTETVAAQRSLLRCERDIGISLMYDIIGARLSRQFKTST